MEDEALPTLGSDAAPEAVNGDDGEMTAHNFQIAANEPLQQAMPNFAR